MEKHLKIRKIDTKFVRFGNGEINTYPTESVREKNVFIIASGSDTGGTINDNIITMLGMIRACRNASATYITLVCAYFPYCRSDKKDQGRTPIMSKLMCDIMKTAGANRLIAVDLHAAQIQGFFDGTIDNLYAINPLIEAIKRDYDVKDVIIVSPDAGGEKRSHAWANKLGVVDTFFTKQRDHNAVSVISRQDLVHNLDFTNKMVILVDDIGDTLGTLNGAARQLKEKNNVGLVVAVVTHGVFSRNAFDNLNDKYIDLMYVTNTLPQAKNQEKSNKIQVVDLSELVSNAIMTCVEGKSMSKLFD
jgi:ribose-phosphate pyrophosphokinase